ncbi:MAG TPA: hypothetical protein VHM26_10725 [Chitinophagaceae bacterium]|nr:hypothetical protein [Chitinophagaceae bacterium]
MLSASRLMPVQKTRRKCINKILIATMLLASSLSLYSQDAIDVTDQTIKIGGTRSEEIMIGFAAGDKIIFNFSEINGKELKEVEVLEYPSTSKFSDFKTSKVEAKSFAVLKQSVYIFRFKNSALGGRVCKIHIQRIPANEGTRNFNTAVTWMDKQDTSWTSFTKDVVIGYDTTYEQKTKKELIKTEQHEELILDKVQRVHSEIHSNGNRTSVFFTFPPNVLTGNKTRKVVAWAYWVGVGEEANQAWKANNKLISGAVKTAASYFTTPLGGFALGLITDLALPNMGEDVYYSVMDQRNRDLFLLKQQHRLFDEGKGVAGYKRFTNPVLCQGTYFVCMMNDNFRQGIDATVKVVAIIEENLYEDRSYTDTIIKPKMEKQIVKEPKIKTERVPVTGL